MGNPISLAGIHPRGRHGRAADHKSRTVCRAVKDTSLSISWQPQDLTLLSRGSGLSSSWGYSLSFHVLKVDQMEHLCDKELWQFLFNRIGSFCLCTNQLCHESRSYLNPILWSWFSIIHDKDQSEGTRVCIRSRSILQGFLSVLCLLSDACLFRAGDTMGWISCRWIDRLECHDSTAWAEEGGSFGF